MHLFNSERGTLAFLSVFSDVAHFTPFHPTLLTLDRIANFKMLLCLG